MEQVLFANRENEIIKASLKEERPIDKKIKYHYQKSKSKIVRCDNCSNCIVSMHNTRYYYKCKFIGESNSGATDIRISYVCDLFS